MALRVTFRCERPGCVAQQQVEARTVEMARAAIARWCGWSSEPSAAGVVDVCPACLCLDAAFGALVREQLGVAGRDPFDVVPELQFTDQRRTPS